MTRKALFPLLLVTLCSAMFGSYAHAASAGRSAAFFDDEDAAGVSSFYSVYGRRYDLGLLPSAGPGLNAAARGSAGKPKPPSEPPPGTSYPNDPYFNKSGSWGQSYADLWGIHKIGGGNSVWDLYRGLGIVIGVVDTGILYNHADIASNIWTNSLELNGLAGVDDDGNGYIDDIRGWDFVGGDNDPLDLNGHGSHVAGIAAGVGDNGKGIIGVAPLAKVMGVRVLNQNGSGTFQAVADGIRYAARTGAHIINLSLGAANVSSTTLTILQSAVDYARSLGSIVVAAAGNSNANADFFSPANLNGVIAVGATDAFDNRASFSNWGDSLFISAPGVDILSLGSKLTHIGTKLTNDYWRASGTSMASPFVSGALALLLNKYPGASLSFLQAQLAAGAVDLGAPGWDPYYGYGRLSLTGALGISTSASTSSTSASSSFGSGATTTSASGTALDELLAKQAVLSQQSAQREEVTAAGATLVPDPAGEREEVFLIG